jgi:hypothetical protein
MCTGAEVAALALAAAGTATSVYSSDQAADDRRRAAALGAENEAAIQDKANEATKDYVTETFDPTKRAENYETEAGSREKALGDLLSKQSELGQGDVGTGATGAVSSTYGQARAAAAASSAQKARNSARLLARAGGAGGLFGNEAIRGADYASDMLGLGVDSALNRTATGARYGAAGNQNLALLGGLLSGAGQAYGGYTSKPKTGG